jgi:hypothetical protein
MEKNYGIQEESDQEAEEVQECAVDENAPEFFQLRQFLSCFAIRTLQHLQAPGSFSLSSGSGIRGSQDQKEAWHVSTSALMANWIERLSNALSKLLALGWLSIRALPAIYLTL